MARPGAGTNPSRRAASLDASSAAAARRRWRGGNEGRTTGFGFPKSRHIRASADFDRIYAQRQRAGDDRLLVFAARNVLGYSRIGMSVSRKYGGAVQRARAKRLLREAFRLSQGEMPSGLDLVLIPRAGVEPELEALKESLQRLSAKLARRLPEVGATSSSGAASGSA